MSQNMSCDFEICLILFICKFNARESHDAALLEQSKQKLEISSFLFHEVCDFTCFLASSHPSPDVWYFVHHVSPLCF